MIAKGKLIVLEGLDRSGKSSVAKHIYQLLAARGNALAINFPDRTTPIGLMINQFLSSKHEISNEAVHLLFSANRWERMKMISETLSKGTHIICDRYWYSGVAYSMAKGMEYEWCLAADRGLVEPDLVIYLKADPETLSKRSNYGQQRFEKVEFQRKVKESFEKVFSKQEGARIRTVETGDNNLYQVKKIVQGIILLQLN